MNAVDAIMCICEGEGICFKDTMGVVGIGHENLKSVQVSVLQGLEDTVFLEWTSVCSASANSPGSMEDT